MMSVRKNLAIGITLGSLSLAASLQSAAKPDEPSASRVAENEIGAQLKTQSSVSKFTANNVFIN